MGDTARCASCAYDIAVPDSSREGDVLVCPKCAGVRLRLSRKDGRWDTTIIHTASCAVCDAVLDFPELLREGDIVNHCDTPQKVTHEFGAYALAPIKSSS